MPLHYISAEIYHGAVDAAAKNTNKKQEEENFMWDEAERLMYQNWSKEEWDPEPEEWAHNVARESFRAADV